MNSLKKYQWIIVTILVFSLDRVSKWLVLHYLISEKPLAVLPFLNLYLTFNTGAAFSFLHHAGGWQEWLFVIVAVGVSFFLIIWQFKIQVDNLWLKIALAFVQGGAFGNLYDRVAYHKVVDFIDFYFKKWHYPVFNLADTAICIGAIMLIIDSVTHDHRTKKE
jgi:signal peptidase II